MQLGSSDELPSLPYAIETSSFSRNSSVISLINLVVQSFTNFGTEKRQDLCEFRYKYPTLYYFRWLGKTD